MFSIRNFGIFLLLSSTLGGCVSVNLGPKKAGRAENVRTTAPGGDYQPVKDTAADQAWQSAKTGNTISYLSECPEASMSLENLTNEALAVLRDREVIEQNSKFFNSRAALETMATGNLDGIQMKMHAVVFKRNGCSFLITYAARKNNFKDEEKFYLQFLESFQAP
jgi:hypothetical protein